MNDETFIYWAVGPVDKKDMWDGDTMRVTVDFGAVLGHVIKVEDVNIRLYGINAPERKKETKERALEVRDFVWSKIGDGKRFKMRSVKTPKGHPWRKGKYGRFLMVIYFWDESLREWVNLNWLLVSLEMAIENFYGDKKPYWWGPHL